MNLLQVRKSFRDLSGRHDLVNEDGANNGADFYINAGSRWLDMHSEMKRSYASAFRFIDVDHFSATFPFCRAIKEVWAATSTQRWQLTKMDLQDMIASYLTGLPSSRNPGTPLYYTPAIVRYVPEDAAVGDLEAFVGFVDVPAGPTYHYNAIIINVPPSEKIMVEIKGLFYSIELSDDDSENFWSAVHPNVLVKAALRELEVFEQNKTKVDAWEKSLGIDVDGINKDMVEEDIAEIDQMED